MSINAEDLKPGMLVRHKGGKLYKVHERHDEADKVAFATTWNGSQRGEDRSRVTCTQWQVNEKYPQGRFYQASRDLRLADLKPE